MGLDVPRKPISYSISIVDISSTSDIGAFYVQNKWGITEKLDLTFGLRSTFFSPTNKLYSAPRISFGLKMRNIDQKQINEKVKIALEQVNLIGYETRYQRELSGGEQQRVASVSYTHLTLPTKRIV